MEEKIANFERSRSVHDSQQIVLTIVDKLSSKYGYHFKHYNRKSSDIVYVENKEGKEITYGLGKGIYSKLGAYGECIEHLLYEKIGENHSQKFFLGDLKNSSLIKKDSILKYAFSLEGAPKEIECIQFIDIQGYAHWLPTIFVNYHLFEKTPLDTNFKRFLSKYVTTSGAAFGLCEEDAYLHALNETIERDLTSEFFMSIIDYQEGVKNRFYQLSYEKFPFYLTKLVDAILQQYKAIEIEFYISKTIFNVWWCICIAKFGKDSHIILPQFGAGCSILYDLSIYRSLSECVQMIDNYIEKNALENIKLNEFVEKYPKFKNIAYFQTKSKFPIVDYNSGNNIDTIPVLDQIEMIVTSMKQQGFLPLKHISFKQGDCHLVCAYTPDLERFYNITKSTTPLPIQHIKNYG